jgi:hypothetical protein
MNLVIPNKVTNIHNNSQTYRVYDPGKAIGDTSPTLPDPPPPPQEDDGCGTIGMIIIIIIVIIVTIYTAGALAGTAGAAASAGGGGAAAGAGAGVAAGGTAAAAGTAATTFSTGLAVLGGTAGLGTAATIAIAATAGAVGSIVGQGLSIAAGYQDEFSWRQVGIAALGAGVTAGLGAAFGGAQSGGFATKFNLATKGTNTAAAINAAVNSVATQGVLLATGLQEKFDWKSVAASAVTAAVSNQISKSINTTAGADDSGNPIRTLSRFAANNPTTANFTTRLISGVTGAYIRHGITHNRIDFANVAADSVGSFLADEMVGGLSAPLETSKQLAIDYSLVEGDAQGPGLRLTNRDASAFERGYEDLLQDRRDIDTSYFDQPSQTSGDRILLAANGEVIQLETETVIGKRERSDYVGGIGPDYPSLQGTSTYGEIRNAPPAIFDSFGYRAATAPARALVGGLRELANIATDAVGSAAQGYYDLVNDTDNGHQFDSQLVNSIAERGVLATTGDLVKGLVSNAPGIGLIGGIYHRDPDSVGNGILGVLSAGAIAASRSTGLRYPNQLDSISEQSAVRLQSGGLKSRSVISPETAKDYLVDRLGWSQSRAQGYVDSFEGPIMARISRPGEGYLRYFDGESGTGNFITRSEFYSPVDARLGLNLDSEFTANIATASQTVNSTQRSIVFEGQVRDGREGVNQTLILDRTKFIFGPGYRYY